MGPEQETTFFKGAIPASEAALFTVPTGEDWIIDTILLTNTTSSTSDTYTLDVVPSGGTAGTGTKLADAVTSTALFVGFIPSGAAQRLGIVLKPGEALQGAQSAAAAFNVIVSGRTRTH
jgi:hypothetical protein